MRAEIKFLFLVAGLFLFSRFVWILLVPTEPISDFATYHKFGGIFSDFKPLDFPIRTQSLNMMMQPWGYPFVPGIVYAITGPSLFAAMALNVLVGTVSLILLYFLGRGLSGAWTGRIAALLFLFWPTQLMYTSVLASEHLAFAAMTAAFLLLLKKQTLPAGIVLGLATTFRYSCALAIISALALIVISKEPLSVRLKGAVTLTIAFILTFSLYYFTMYAIYRQAPRPRNTASFLEGSNYSTGGQWSQEDTTAYWSFATYEEADRFVWNTLKERIASSPARYAKLMLRKTITLWKDEDFGPYFSMKAPAGIVSYDVCQAYYVALLIAALIGTIPLAHKDWRSFTPLLLFPLSITMPHAVVVTQARYHYVAMPVIIIFAAGGILALISASKRSPAR